MKNGCLPCLLHPPREKQKSAYHTLVPDDGHPLLSAINTFRNQTEVIFAHSSLGSVEGTVRTSCHLQVTTARAGGGRVGLLVTQILKPLTFSLFCTLSPV